MKKKCFVLGNCQAQPLRFILNQSKSFSNYFELVDFPAVHVAKPDQVLALHRELSDAGLVLCQPIAEGYRGNIGLGTETIFRYMTETALKITYPSIYFSGYNPELFYLKNELGSSIAKDFDYHCKVIFNSFLAGFAVDETCNYLCGEKAFSLSQVSEDWIEKSVVEIRKRERDIDIKVSQCIAESFRERRLFWTFNHPSNFLLMSVAQEIFKLLEINYDLNYFDCPELLDGTIYPILPEIKSRLKLNFDSQKKLQNKKKTLRQSKSSRKLFRFL